MRNFGTLWTIRRSEELSKEERAILRRAIQVRVEEYLAAGGEIEELQGFPETEERPDYARPVFIHSEGQA